MLAASSIDSASQRLTWSNLAYVSGAVFTILAAMVVLLEKRSVATNTSVGRKGRSQQASKKSLLAEFLGLFAAIVSLGGTVGAIHYGNLISHLKDDDLESFKTQASVDIAQAGTTAQNALWSSMQARNDATNAADNTKGLQGGMTAIKTQIETQGRLYRGSHRAIKPSGVEVKTLFGFGRTFVQVVCNAGDQEACNLQRQLLTLLSVASIPTIPGTVFGPGLSDPLNVPGVHLHYDESVKSRELADRILKILETSEVHAEEGKQVTSDKVVPLPEEQLLRYNRIEPDSRLWIVIGPAR